VIRTAADVGAIIRDRRRKLRLDQGALAKRVGVSRQWIVDVEKGKPRAGVELVLRTLAALGVSLAPSEGPPVAARPAGPAARPAVDLDAIIAAARRPKR
jgi:HTH-type transcriptional regulator/antitoxin HipB